jgi:hypothetical protein
MRDTISAGTVVEEEFLASATVTPDTDLCFRTRPARNLWLLSYQPIVKDNRIAPALLRLQHFAESVKLYFIS